MITNFTCEHCNQTLPIQEPSKLSCSSCGKPSWPSEVKAIAKSGNKILAIKVYRMATNLGLKEAKDAVEQYMASGQLPTPTQLAAPGMHTAPPTSDSSREQEEFFALCRTSPINAIKIYREKTGLGLKESKDAIDAIRTGASKQLPTGFFGARAQEPSPLGQLIEILRAGNKIEAIKLYRDKTGLGLKEAKDAVEAYMANSGSPLAPPFGGEMTQAPAAPPPQQQDVRQRVATLLAEGNYIEAIRFYREKTGLGLKEAKDAVDAARAGQPLPLTFIATPIEQPQTYSSHQPEQELLSLIQNQNLIGAIKLYRSETGLGLAESKAAVEAIARGEKRPPFFSVTPTQAAKPAADPNAAFREELLAVLKNDGVIAAIQRYRAKTGVSLKEGKDFIDALEENPNTPFPVIN